MEPLGPPPWSQVAHFRVFFRISTGPPLSPHCPEAAKRAPGSILQPPGLDFRGSGPRFWKVWASPEPVLEIPGPVSSLYYWSLIHRRARSGRCRRQLKIWRRRLVWFGLVWLRRRPEPGWCTRRKAQQKAARKHSHMEPGGKAPGDVAASCQESGRKDGKPARAPQHDCSTRTLQP